MHEHDTDLILSLAAEELDGPDRDAAITEVASCAQCTSDLELQRTAIEYLSGVPRVYLSATESARLRDGVRGALGHGAEPAPASPRRSPRRFRFGVLAGAAAVLVAVVAAAPALNLVGGGSTSETGDDVFAVATPGTEMARDDADRTMSQSSPAAPEAAPLPPADAVAGAGSDPMPTAAAPTAPDVLPSLPDDIDLFALKAQVESGAFSEVDGAPATGEESPTPSVATMQDAGGAGTSAEQCDLPAVAGDAGSLVEVLGLIRRNGGEALVAAFIDDDGTVTVAIIDASTCEVVESTSP